MTEENKKSSILCDECEHFLRMYKGAGVGTCRKGSKKYRSEDALCDLTELNEESELDSVLSGYSCHSCSKDILDSDFTGEHSIGSFDDNGKIVHYYCSDCWFEIDQEREKVRRHFDLE